MAVALTAQSDHRLRELALRGDDAAFEALVGPLVEPAVRLAYSMLGDPWEAEDAVQEAVTRAWRKLHQLRPGMPVRPWVLAIVVNQCHNVRRTRWFKTVLLADIFRPDAEADLEKLDLERAVERLPATDRQAIFMHFYLDLSVEEVAVVLGVSASAARGRIYRACRRLRPGLVEEDR